MKAQLQACTYNYSLSLDKKNLEELIHSLTDMLNDSSKEFIEISLDPLEIKKTLYISVK